MQEEEAPPDAEADGHKAVVGGTEVADAGHARGLAQAPIQRVLPPAMACVYVACCLAMKLQVPARRMDLRRRPPMHTSTSIQRPCMLVFWRLMLSSLRSKSPTKVDAAAELWDGTMSCTMTLNGSSRGPGGPVVRAREVLCGAGALGDRGCMVPAHLHCSRPPFWRAA